MTSLYIVVLFKSSPGRIECVVPVMTRNGLRFVVSTACYVNA
jgi:hypothetical protein